MRLPFFQSKVSKGPVRVPLPEMINTVFAVYFQSQRPAPPTPEQLAPVVQAWLERHAPEPVRTGLREYGAKFLDVDVQPRAFLPPPPLDMLRLFKSGEREEQRFLDATHMVLVSCPGIPALASLAYWTALSAARALAEAAGGVILDPEFPRLLPLEKHADGVPEGAYVRVWDHIIVPFSTDHRGLAWMTTKGLGRFGLPELEITDMPPNLAERLLPLANGVAQQVLDTLFRQAAERQEPARELVLGPELRLTLEEVVRGYSDDANPAPPPGARGWTTLRLEYRPGRKDEDSFLRLLPPATFKGGQGVWLNSLWTDLMGSEDTLRHVKGDSEAMEAAKMQARSELPQVRQRFQAGLQPGETLLVKHGFPTRGDDHEYMWIVVNTWHGDRVTGQLANDPRIRMDLRAGQTVELREADLADWAITRADGSMEGGYTNRVVMQEGG